MILYLNRLENDSFTKIGVIDNASSVIWTQRFHAVGDFEVYVAASSELLEMLQGDVFLTRDDSDTAMYVESIKLSTSEDGGDYLTISGRSAEVMLTWRIVYKAVFSSSTNTAETIVRSLLNTYLVKRLPHFTGIYYIDFLSLASANGWTDYCTHQYTGKMLSDIIFGLCTEYQYGIKFVWTGNGFVITLYKGTDRSYAQWSVPRVIFAPEYDNIGNTEYVFDTTNFANYALVGGQGQGSDRVFVTVSSGENVKGFNLRGVWLDARNTSSKTDSGEMSDSEYQAMLKNDGLTQLAERQTTQAFSGEVIYNSMYKYGTDYFLGDTVSIKNRYGITGNAVVTAVSEVEDAEGYRVVPTLSAWALS